MADLLKIQKILDTFEEDIKHLVKVKQEDMSIAALNEGSREPRAFLTWQTLSAAPEISTTKTQGWNLFVFIDLVTAEDDNILVNKIYMAIMGNPRRRDKEMNVQAQRTLPVEFVRAGSDPDAKCVLVTCQFQVVYLEG